MQVQTFSPQSATILELLAREDKALLIRRDAFLVLDLLLHVLDSVGWLHIKSNSLTREGLHENLHDSSLQETKEEAEKTWKGLVRITQSVQGGLLVHACPFV